MRLISLTNSKKKQLFFMNKHTKSETEFQNLVLHKQSTAFQVFACSIYQVFLKAEQIRKLWSWFTNAINPTENKTYENDQYSLQISHYMTKLFSPQSQNQILILNTSSPLNFIYINWELYIKRQDLPCSKHRSSFHFSIHFILRNKERKEKKTESDVAQ